VFSTVSGRALAA
jgi:hypothetical protein